ncbi:LacI family DNA-binding transcriptional regulator [Propionibacteriaceae bacterium G1746]
MDELGYVYHQAAAQLRRQVSRTIGVIVTNIDRPHFGELLVGLETTLTDRGYTLLVISTRDQLDLQQRAIRTLREYQVAAVALVPATGTTSAHLDELRSWGIPLLFLVRYVRGDGIAYAGPDNVAGGRLVGEHLIGHGCRRLLYLGGRPRINTREDRIAGVHEAIAASHESIEFAEQVCLPTAAGGFAAGQELLASGGPLPDGILCHGDLVAVGLHRALHDAGMTGATRVVSFDGIAVSGYVVPRLTTAASNAGELGRAAAQSLVEGLEQGFPVQSTRPVPTLVVGESCGVHDDA